MFSMNDLPDEILDTILSFCHKPTILSLLKSCKRLRRLAEYWLYCDVEFCNFQRIGHRNLPGLLVTLTNRSDLAVLVKILRIGLPANGARGSALNPYQKGNDTRGLDLPPSYLDRVHSRSEHLFHENFRGNEDACLSLILEATQNLQVLEFWFEILPSWIDAEDGRYDHPILMSYLYDIASPDTQTSALTLLRHVTISVDTSMILSGLRHKLGTEEVEAFLGFPALETLHIPLVSEDPVTIDTCRVFLPALTTLVIPWYQTDDSVLRQLLSRTPRLKTLDLIDFHRPTTRARQDLLFHRPDFAAALRQVSCTLEDLRLAISPDDLGDGGRSPSQIYCLSGFGPSPQSLERFERLRNLEIPLAAVCGLRNDTNIDLSDYLPRSLRRVNFTNGPTLKGLSRRSLKHLEGRWKIWKMKNALEVLVRYVQSVKERSLPLEELRVQLQPLNAAGWETWDGKRLRESGDDSGVSVDIVTVKS